MSAIRSSQRRLQATDQQEELPRLQCPIHLNRPKFHPNPGRDACSEMGYDSIPHFREHLKRAHMKAHPVAASGTSTPAVTQFVLTEKQIEEISLVTRRREKDTKDSRRRKWTEVYRIIFPKADEIPAPFCVGAEHARERAKNPDDKLVSLFAILRSCPVDDARERLRDVATFLDVLGGRYDDLIGNAVQHGSDIVSGDCEGREVQLVEREAPSLDSLPSPQGYDSSGIVYLLLFR